jgi:Response regulator receiver domain
LLDITMPQMDGYELCQILKQNPLTADIPIIFVSALDESMDKAKAFEVGAVDYVAKPFQWAEVQARVKTQLALRQLQQHPSALEFSRAEQQILWAESTPAIAHFHLTTHLTANPTPHTELYDWHLTHPHLLYLTLACAEHSTPSSTVLLATLRGLFKGLSLEPNLEKRVDHAQSFIDPDLKRCDENLRLFHGELNGNDCTLTYIAQGYEIVLVRQQATMAQASAATLRFEPGDRLLIGSEGLEKALILDFPA